MRRFFFTFLTVLLVTAIPRTGQIMAGDDMAAAGANAYLTFDSFDGGGPEYTVVLNTDIVAYEHKGQYKDPNHEEMDGASYNVTFIFKGLKSGEGTLTVKERSPIAGNVDRTYSVRVDEALNVMISPL